MGTVFAVVCVVAILFVILTFVFVVQRDDERKKREKYESLLEGSGVTAEKACAEIERLRTENGQLRTKIDKKTSKWVQERTKLEKDLDDAQEGRREAWEQRDELSEKVGAALRLLKDGPAKGGTVNVVNTLDPDRIIGGGRYA
jgi:septal ring factor EnvC (AmiA/AmiB activator)